VHEPDLGRLIISGKRNLLKLISFYQLLCVETTFIKYILFFVKRMNRACRCFAFRGNAGAGERFAVELELKDHDAKIRAGFLS